MKILQVWNNKVFPENYKSCIKSVNDICKDNNLEHVIVGNKKELFADFSITFIPFQDCVTKYSTDWWERILNRHITQSDFIRLNFIIEDPEIFYIDVDVELLKLPEFEKNDKPYFGMSFNYIDFFMLYGNGNSSFLKALLNIALKGTPSNYFFMGFFAAVYKQNSQNIKKINIIPKECYKRNWF
jgi:hypothetical protein